MTELNKSMPPLPARFLSLPVNDRGFPVPWFVATIDGKPDFRVVRPGGAAIARKHHICWLCGQKLGQYLAFVIGPMCSINRISSEPPCHLECAQFAAMACPFLIKPGARRNEKDIPAEAIDPAGEFLKRNPGVACIWVCKSFNMMRVDNGLLFQLHEPTSVEWYCEGRTATLAEVVASIESGMPLLMTAAEKEGARAVEALGVAAQKAIQYLPKGDDRAERQNDRTDLSGSDRMEIE